MPFGPKARVANQYLIPGQNLPIIFMVAHFKMFPAKITNCHFAPDYRHIYPQTVTFTLFGNFSRYLSHFLPSLPPEVTVAG